MDGPAVDRGDRESTLNGRPALIRFIGVDIGGTKTALVLGESSAGDRMSIREKIVFPMGDGKSPAAILDGIGDALPALLIKHGLQPGGIAGCGISCGGPLDSRKGVLLSPPNLPGWSGYPIVSELEKRTGLRARLENDANAGALAERRWGAARGFDHIVFLTFGTGMGAGLILNGRLYSGANGMAGEIGHIRLSDQGPVGFGKAGSFEGFCSGAGIARLARIKVQEALQSGRTVSFCPRPEAAESLTARDVAEAANRGDDLAREIFRISGEYLGKGLAILIDVLNPQIIVIGSIYARCEALLRDAALAAVEKESLRISRDACRIAPAGLGDALGDHAALAVAVDGPE
jgi:glucokinase